MYKGIVKCPKCEGGNLVRKSRRRNKFHELQKYFCRDCGKYFTATLQVLKGRTSPRTINSWLHGFKDVLAGARNNYERHQLVEDFMLVNDTCTIATEVPVWFWEKNINSDNGGVGICGHIDKMNVNIPSKVERPFNIVKGEYEGSGYGQR
jgi:hypothetical protein